MANLPDLLAALRDFQAEHADECHRASNCGQVTTPKFIPIVTACAFSIQ